MIHFRSIEGYPPIQNLLKTMTFSKDRIVTIFSTILSRNIKPFNIVDTHVIFKRTYIGQENRVFRFLFGYLFFYLYILGYLILKRPQKILYFESISAIPALIYKFFFRQTEVFAHYHEYTTKDEYLNGMLIERFSHDLEKRQYNKFKWISHTNYDRLQLFKNDCNLDCESILKIMPNYPLLEWIDIKEVGKNSTLDTFRFVYVGPLNEEDTYINEVCDYIGSHNDFSLEIISNRVPVTFIERIKTKQYHNITILGEIENAKLPDVLTSNKIGLILYKCKTLNQIHAQPNKFFEYLRAGLDIWYPKEMIGCKEFTSFVSPKIIPIDFNNIEQSVIGYKPELVYPPRSFSKFSTEYAVAELIKQLNN